MSKKQLSNWFGFLKLDLVIRQTVRHLVYEKGDLPYKELVAHIEKVIIEEMVKIKGSKYKAAKSSGIDYRTANRKVSNVAKSLRV